MSGSILFTEPGDDENPMSDAEKIAELEAQVRSLTEQLAAAPSPQPAKVTNLANMLRSESCSFGTLVQSPSPFYVAYGGPLLSEALDFIFIDTCVSIASG